MARLLLLGALAVVTSLLAFSQDALSHYSTGIYQYEHQDGCSGGGQTDPMNLVFYNKGMQSYVLNHLNLHQGWTNSSGSQMDFLDHGCYRSQDWQRASGSGSRYHIRVMGGQNSDPYWGYYSQASVHYERGGTFLCDLWPDMDHVVQNFDDARTEFSITWLLANHYWTYADNGNTAPSPQCDGSNPHSFDGWTHWLKIVSYSGH